MGSNVRAIMIVGEDADSVEDYFFRDNSPEYSIVKAKSLKEAQANLHNKLWDLAIVDVCLPAGSGYAVMRELSSGMAERIMAVTDRNSVADRVECYTHGADTILTKPFIDAEFTAAIASMLRRVKKQSGSRMRDWNLDVETRRLQSPEGKSVPLSERDFDFMKTIMAAAGEPVTREDLLALLEPEGTSTNVRSLDMRVARLRRHIEDHLDTPAPILTIQKVGFVFERRRRN